MTMESATEELDSLLQQSRARALAVRCAAGRVAERRTGFVDDPALCGTGILFAGEDVFDFVPRTQLRRERLHLAMVGKYGTKHEELDLNPTDQDLEGAIEEFAYYSDEPSADAGALPVWFLSKLSRPKTDSRTERRRC